MGQLAQVLNATLYARHFRNTSKYYRTYGRLPNYLEPVLFSEKIQWRKLFDQNPLFPIFCDKLSVRDFVQDSAPLLKLPEILWTGSDPAAIPHKQLPDRYVVKPNHRSNCNFFIQKPGGLSDEQIVRMRRWVNTQQGRQNKEWAYQSITGQLLVEEMLDTDPDPSMSRDFRFHVFDGLVHAIVVEFSEFAEAGRTVLDTDAFYDRNWRRLPYRRVRTKLLPPASVARPAKLVEMIASAEALGRGLDYIRADFFLIGDDVYFGEVTIYPGSGFNIYVLDDSIGGPPSEGFYADMGHLWKLPEV